MVRVGGARCRIGRHGAIDREAGCLSHLRQEFVLDGLLSCGQHEFQLRAVLDVRADRPGRAVHGLDHGQAHLQRQAVEIEVGVAEAGAPVPEHAEGEAPPLLCMDGGVEECAARQRLRFGRISRCRG